MQGVSILGKVDRLTVSSLFPKKHPDFPTCSRVKFKFNIFRGLGHISGIHSDDDMSKFTAYLSNNIFLLYLLISVGGLLLLALGCLCGCCCERVWNRRRGGASWWDVLTGNEINHQLKSKSKKVPSGTTRKLPSKNSERDATESAPLLESGKLPAWARDT